MERVEVKNVCKSYGKFVAVDNVNMSVSDGSIYGLLGPNGAGKSSTMRMIMNITAPDSGEVFLFGEKFTEKHKKNIGYLPEERGLYPKMKVVDQLVFLSELKGMKKKQAYDNSMMWLEKIGMIEWANKKVNELSKGMAQKIQFISTINHNPQLIIMDEPFSGLDPVNSRFFKDIIIDLKKEGKTIILSTHLMENAEKLCDNICLINKGKVVLSGNLQKIKEENSKNSVIVYYSGDNSKVFELEEVSEIDDSGNYMEITLKNHVSKTGFLKRLVLTDLEISRYESIETSLNDIFIQCVSGKGEK
ncbi:MAG: ATP-binding cassette domain-containing protein [Candidatus Muirbacterium halophilum]|nr:ATP-binding cassette domain-containing protein [Candidatus Muirbacterium halophilum]MCK9477412.1 ATP-binding cassette domain-containing protein [Candidatus Muirbacterium halophilum]